MKPPKCQPFYRDLDEHPPRRKRWPKIAEDVRKVWSPEVDPCLRAKLGTHPGPAKWPEWDDEGDLQNQMA